MINNPARQSPEFRHYVSGACFFRVEPPPGFPEVDSTLARMFRLDPAEQCAALAGIAVAERTALLHSLAGTITRAIYHRERFQFILREVEDRRRRAGLIFGGDRFGRSAVYEAASMLAAANSIVEEVVFLAARRAGQSEVLADRWKTYAEARVRRDGPLVPEVVLLRARDAWFRQLSDYRNALTHRGSIPVGGFGYYPPGDPSPEATDPAMNLFLVPDHASIGRPARPATWTYRDGRRLEDLVRDVWQGLESLLLDVGREWGETPPSAGSVPADQVPNVVVALPKLAMLGAPGGALIAPIFTTEALALAFLATQPTMRAEPTPTRLCHLGPPRWLLWIPSLSSAPAGIDRLLFAIDPTIAPGRGIVHEQVVGDLAVQPLRALPSGLFVDLPAEDVPGVDTIYVLR